MTHDFLPETGKTNLFPPKIRKNDFKHRFFIESFGVKIGFSTNSPEALDAVREAVGIYLPGVFREIEATETEHNFFYFWGKRNRDTLYKNAEKLFGLEKRENAVDLAASRIRLTVAEFTSEHVFIHAGVVAWKNKAIIFPARSFRGKTSLTLALVQRGALYYSDEYAILDADGCLHPFPKMLSVRGVIDEHRQVDYPIEKFGGTAGTEKIPVGMIVITEYKEKARWNPKVLSPAKGIIETLQHTLPIRRNPQFTLKVLQKVAESAMFVNSKRGDLSKSADSILRFIDDNI
jgi:hypothetical protein